MQRILRCYAERSEAGGWEAICLDLDVAVQAGSFDDAVAELHRAIDLYLESVADLPESERARLLHRPAPLSLRLKFLWAMVRGLFAGTAPGGRSAGFTWPAPA